MWGEQFKWVEIASSFFQGGCQVFSGFPMSPPRYAVWIKSSFFDLWKEIAIWVMYFDLLAPLDSPRLAASLLRTVVSSL